MKPQPPPRLHSESEIVRLLWLAIFASVFSFLFYNRHGDVLLYGDAVSHINIARRVFDSKTPGLLQLGTVWLPLPHLLILPFIVSTRMWQSGAGGSIPSMAAYVFGVLGIFRLARTVLSENRSIEATRNIVPWAAALIFAANPNLIYMQATAMGESLYLALFIWPLAYFAEFARGSANASRSLTKCGLCLAAGSLTRYDGWFLSAVVVVVAVIVSPRLGKVRKEGISRFVGPRVLAKFALVAVSAPLLWLAYNAVVYKNSLEFVNGPYSAKAIAEKSGTVNPAQGNVLAAGSYFLKAAELNVGETNWQQRLWLLLALVGSLAAAFGGGQIALLLWTPLPFYAYSVAYGSVPIFLPKWWPFSYYNVRYGLQLLPAFAVFGVMGISFLVQSVVKMPRFTPFNRWAGVATFLNVLALMGVSYGSIWRADPICYREAFINARGRRALDQQLASWIKSLPTNSTLLMYLGEHVGALEQAAIPLRRVINEGNHKMWRQPSDPEGLWERALSDPAQYADYAIGFENDEVWKAAQNRHLSALVEIHTTGQPRAIIFQGRGQRPWAGFFPRTNAVITRVNADCGIEEIPMIKSGHLHLFFWCPIRPMNSQNIVDLIHREIAGGFVVTSLTRLVLAAILGGAIGLEREIRHRPAGLRTNMFICFGAAMFTVLSDGLAVLNVGDHTRIAAQIIPGIGFIGAGSILHTRGLTTGLTTAATLFVVASVGMATGGGLYLTAVFATMVVLIALFMLGHLERTFNLKTLVVSYEVTGPSAEQISQEVNRILERGHRMMQNILTGNTSQHVRMQFDVAGCNREQKQLLRDLKASSVLGSVTSLGPVELE
jgi:uncharacterized membrane protein YhiD involved in acid resistance